MATINSVLGPLETADLGFTLTHEHIFTASAGICRRTRSCSATLSDLPMKLARRQPHNVLVDLWRHQDDGHETGPCQEKNSKHERLRAVTSQ
jgi:predicted metal-dependent phosphotriesterase family hydrolase